MVDSDSAPESPKRGTMLARILALGWTSLRRTVLAIGLTIDGWARRTISRTGRLGIGLASRVGNVKVRDVLKWSAITAVSVIGLAFLITLVLVFYPATQIPASEPPAETRYLDQGWGVQRESPERETYYYTAQGSTLQGLPMRYNWLVNLETPWGRRRLADPSHMRSLGFVVDPVPTRANPDLLPVGFSRHFDDALGEDLLDLSCAACHTGQINITRNGRTVGIRIDGGAAMHAATAMEIGHFGPVMLGSVASTYFNPLKFNRFARRVLGEEAYSRGKSELRRQMWAFLKAGVDFFAMEQFNHLYPTAEGFGRLDAVGRISNTVFGQNLDRKNLHVADAPVSFPYLWNIWKFDWVQYLAFVSQPMARNVGEALGVGASYKLIDRYGRPLPAAEQFRTSIRFDGIHQIESALQKLKPPPWPEDLLGPIDQAKASRGRELFQNHCQGCHGPHVAADAIKMRDAPGKGPDAPQWTIKTIDIRDIGTDPTAVLNATQILVDLSRAGLPIDRVRALMGDQLQQLQERSASAIAQLKNDIRSADAAQRAALQKVLADAERYAPTADSIQRRLDSINLSAVSIPDGLNILGLLVRDRYYTEHGFTKADRECYDGFGTLDMPEANTGYKPRPIAGVWATPPFLHNGSVPTLYHLLSPASERPRKFFVGRREFDPVNVGFVTEPLSKGGFWFDTRVRGNANTGHEFRAGYVPYDPQHPERVQYGVIGPELTMEQRYDLIEYLKIHRDDPEDAKPYTPAVCGPAQGGSR
ncbi:MAG: cytochrome c [Acidobacteriota bacterium]|nr:cytochrome c [Acidobacteriota bacterium]